MKSNSFFALSAFQFLPFTQACGGHFAAETVARAPQIRRTTPGSLGKTVIQNVQVFNGRNMTGSQTVVIDQTTISHSNDTAGATHFINGTGKYLIPGLIENHCHVADSADFSGHENLTSYGVTTAMNMACHNYTACALHRGPEAVGLTDMLTAGFPAVGPNSSHSRAPGFDTSQEVYPYSDPVQLADWTIGNNSNFYKITAEINGPTQELQNGIVENMHAQGYQAQTHASAIYSYNQAIISKTDGIQHMPSDGLLTPDMIQKIKQQGQYVTPTMHIFKTAFTDPDSDILSYLQGSSDAKNQTYLNVIHNVQALYRAGVPLLAGTDSVGTLSPTVVLPFGLSLHKELQHLVYEAGMSSVDALNAATRDAAKYHELPDRGVIEVGKRADLLLLNKNPVAEIANTLDIDTIWLAGRRYEGELKVGGSD